MSLGKRLARSVAISAVIGFASFLLSAHPLSWLLATGVFYYDFWGRSPESASQRRGK